MVKTLVVAYDDTVLRVTSDYLKSIPGLEVDAVQDGDEAIDRLSDGDVRIVVLEDEARDALKVAKTAHGLESKVIVLTDVRNEVETRESFARYEPVAYLHKPDYHSKLVEVVKGCL